MSVSLQGDTGSREIKAESHAELVHPSLALLLTGHHSKRGDTCWPNSSEHTRETMSPRNPSGLTEYSQAPKDKRERE